MIELKTPESQPDPSQIQEWFSEDAQPTKLHQEWALNWWLLVGTMIALIVLFSTAAYRYQRQVALLPPQLLALADSAEEEQDWPLVMSRLHRYLTVKSSDLKTTLRLADLYYERAGSREDVRAAVLLYSRCISNDPDKVGDDIKLKLRYSMMLAIVNPTAALREIDRMLPDELELENALKGEPVLVEALQLRTEVLEQLSIKGKTDNDESRAKLIADYEMLTRVSVDNPNHIQKLALLCRQEADVVEFANSGRAAQLIRKADRLMDEAVEQHPTNVDVLLQRFQYQIRYSKSRYPDTSDLQRILELDHSNPRALMSLAFFLAEGRTDDNLRNSKTTLRAAQDFLERSMDELPDRSYPLVALANIHLQLQDPNKAKSVIQQAVREYPDSHIVHVADTKLALMQGRIDDATEGIRRIRLASRRTQTVAWSRAEQLTEARTQSLIADVLEAELILQSYEEKVARPKVTKLLRSIDCSRLQSQDRVSVLEDIGRLFAKVEDWEYAIEVFQRARTTGIVSLDSDIILAETFERLGKRDQAIQVYRELSTGRLPANWEKNVWFQLGILNLRGEVNGASKRRWDEAEKASEKLLAIAPASEEAFLLKMSLKLAKGVTDQASVIGELKAAEANFGQSVRFWLLCMDIYRDLEQFQLLQQSMERLAEVTSGAPENIVEAASRPILTNRLTEEDLNYVKRISADWADGAFEQKVDLVREWCRELPDSISARLALANLGTVDNRADLVQEAVQSLQGSEIGGGYFWRISEVSQLLASFRSGNRADGAVAQKKSESLAAQYPGHASVAQLAANCQETCGNVDAASKHYQRAVKIKPTKWAIDGYLRTLVLMRDWKKSREFVKQIPEEVRLTRESLDLVVNALCEDKQFDAAKEAIAQFVAKNNGHTAHTNYLLGSVLMREPTREHALEAHRLLQNAVTLSPSNLNYWIALFHYQINTYPDLWTEEACKTAGHIRWLLQAHSKSYAPEWSSLILAQTLQLSGRLADADAFFRKTVKLNPQTVSLGWIPNGILSKDVTATDTPIAPEVAWLAGDDNARTLAALWAIWHGESKVGLAIPQDDVRLNSQVAVLNGDEAAAIELLESIESEEQGSGDLLLLAVLFDRVQDESAARKARMSCIGQQNVPDFALQKVLDHALAANDFELADASFQVMQGSMVDPVLRDVTRTQIDLGLGRVEGDLGQWVRTRSQDLNDDSQQEAFRSQMIDVLAEQGHDIPAAKLLDETLQGNPKREILQGRWMASQPRQVEETMLWLKKEQEVPPEVLVEVSHQLLQHLDDQSPHRGELISLANSMLEREPELSRVQWLMLGSVFERLQLFNEALRACEVAMPEDGTTSLVEHHLVWLKGGYLRTLPDSFAELDRLVRAFGPREDLMDTRSVFHLLDGQGEAAKNITRLTSLFEPQDTNFRLHNRLADAQQLPPEKRRGAFQVLGEKEQRGATVLTMTLLRQHSRAANAPNDAIGQAARMMVMKLTDLWAKLAALGRMLRQHPSVQILIADGSAETNDWQSAIAIYGRLITPETTDTKLLFKRAVAYIATEQWELAKVDLWRALQHAPDAEQSELADQLTGLLLQQSEPQWTVLEPTEMKSQGGAALTLQDDGSILASGTNPDRDTYTLIARPGLDQITAIRLEALPDPSLPGNGPGRAESTQYGNFHLNELSVFSSDRPVPLTAISTTYDTHDTAPLSIDGQIDDAIGWEVYGATGQAHTAFLAAQLQRDANADLKFEFHFSTNAYKQHNLGRFRLSVSGEPTAFDQERQRLAAMKLADPWAKLAAAYHILGDQASLNSLIEQHPTAEFGVADLLAAEQDWELAVAAYSRLITPETMDANLMAGRAAASIGAGQWELAKADWRRVIALQPDQLQQAFDTFLNAERWIEAAEFGRKLAEQHPEDSICWLRVAPAVVFSNEKDAYGLFCDWIMQQPIETAERAERAIKVCLLQPNGVDLAELPGVTLAKELDEGTALVENSPWFWATRALLAFRSGDAVAAVSYVAKSVECKPTDLCQPMNLAVLALAEHQLHHPDEARTALKEASQLITRLKANLAKGSHFDLQIAEILYREAEAKMGDEPNPTGTSNE